MNDQEERETMCAERGCTSFQVIVKTYKRSPLHGQPVQVRCTRCGRRWPVMTKESWMPKGLS